MPKPYQIGKRRGKLELYFRDAAGKRHRHTLGTDDEAEAELLAPAIFAEASRPRGSTIGELWGAYDRDKADRAILAARETTWKALRARFSDMDAEAITAEDSLAHMEDRRAKAIKDSTVYTELSHLRTTLNWAVKMGLIEKAPYIKRPPQPAPRDARLTKDEVRALVAAAPLPHVKLYITLAIGTGARNAALLGLTWDRCFFDSGRIDLRDPELKMRHKGRAIVPMNNSVREALTLAQQKAKSRYVVEWRGERVLSVKKSIKTAARKVGVVASPHVFRHSAACIMAEEGIPMEEIAQYLGHSDVKVTRRIYARYSPEYLSKAAGALEL
jgi:integrase